MKLAQMPMQSKKSKINSNIGCIETNNHSDTGVTNMINSNIGCIETNWNSYSIEKKLSINSNIGCIETVKHGGAKKGRKKINSNIGCIETSGRTIRI